MKKLATAIAAGALFLSVIPALAKSDKAKGPVEKATGSVGYDAYGTYRWLDFNAHEGSDECSAYWNLDGNWGIDFVLGASTYPHTWIVSGDTIDGASTGNTYDATITLDGDNITVVAVYRLGSVAYPYTYTAVGTISNTGALSGTWTDDRSHSGTWSSTSGSATKVMSGCEGKGDLMYNDEAGNWYNVDVQYVNVDGSGDEAWFAGPVTSASNAGWISNWLFAKVLDGDEPAYMVDEVWGSFTSESAAKLGVAEMTDPGDGPFSILDGNLQVHTY